MSFNVLMSNLQKSSIDKLLDWKVADYQHATSFDLTAKKKIRRIKIKKRKVRMKKQI